MSTICRNTRKNRAIRLDRAITILRLTWRTTIGRLYRLTMESRLARYQTPGGMASMNRQDRLNRTIRLTGIHRLCRVRVGVRLSDGVYA